MDSGQGKFVFWGRQYYRRFTHRLNPDGSYDSICMYCFLTAATSQTEDQLASLERDHVFQCWRKHSPFARTTARPPS